MYLAYDKQQRTKYHCNFQDDVRLVGRISIFAIFFWHFLLQLGSIAAS